MKFTLNPPSLLRELVNTAGNTVIPILPATEATEIDGFGQWIVATATPTAVVSSFNPLAGTQVSAGASVDSNMNGFSIMSKAYAFRLSAHRKAGATTSLLDNTAIIYCGPNEVGRIYVDATAQKGGQLHWSSGAIGQFDDRFTLFQSVSAITGGIIEADDNIYTKATHGLVTGQPVVLTSLTGGTGLTATTRYYFHKLSANTGYLCSSRANAIAGTAVDVTLDATDVVLTPHTDLGIVLDQVDPALQLCFEIYGED
jgi:hypothetical protein